MRSEFTAVLQRDGEFYMALCPEVPEANGQGDTREEALDDLRAAIALCLDVRREERLKGLPDEAEYTTVIVEQ